MHRKPLLELLGIYEEHHPGESAVVERFISFVKRYPDCFERNLECGHITGSAWVVNAEGNQVLLTHHRKLNIWVQLGGHADGEAAIDQVALREAEEESGLNDLIIEPGIFDLDIHRIPQRKGDPEHDHYDVRFVVRHEGDSPFVVSDESHDLAWIDIHDIEKVTQEESMIRMQRKWLERIGIPDNP